MESVQHNGAITFRADDMIEPWASWSRAVVAFGEKVNV